MKQFTAEQKHEILLEYQFHSPTHSFAALAARHAVVGGGEVVRRWHQRWNRTAASLQHKKGAGRPRLLTPSQVQRYVATPIRQKNRAHQAVHYSQLQPAVVAQTGKPVSTRTIRRYGKEELKACVKRGKKRTAEERESVQRTQAPCRCLDVE